MMTQPPIDKRTLLSHSALFSELAPAELDQLVQFAKVKQFKSKQVIFYKGEEGQRLFAILDGRVQISTLSEEGKEMTLVILEPGDLFGEISALDGRERTATATALESTDLLIIERRDFIPFLERHPKIALKLLSALCSRIRATDELIEDALFLNLPSRLAKKLLALADTYGENIEEGTRINLKLSQTELGKLVSTSRESICKQIGVWQEAGLISFNRGYITIHQPEKLEDLVFGDF
ncbi:MAG: Crp/Fnr family transcriptional regulator [Methylohalobius sp. ZOD2]|nr:Crp/Fnr family transcriptional regulator [Methylothermaceae bacterium]